MQLNQPEEFFNVANSINVFAADSAPLHRLGGGYFNGYVFLSTPRNANPGCFLDLEVNPLPFDPSTCSLSLPSGFTWGLGGDVIQGRILSRVETFNVDAPVVIWVETASFGGTGDPTTTFKSVVPQFGPNSPFANPDAGMPTGPEPPTADLIKTFTFPGQPNPVLDFTTASVNGTIYLFWTVPNQNTICWAAFDGTNATPNGTLIALSSSTIFSIDATAVQMLDQSTGIQTTRIAVVALSLSDDANNVLPTLSGWLFETDGTLVQTLALPPLPNPNSGNIDAFSSTIRATWGTLTGNQSCNANGLVLAYVPSHGSAAFNAFALPSVADINALGPLLINSVDLNGGQEFEWTDMDPSAGVWGNTVEAMATSGPLSVLFPIPVPTRAGAITIYVGNAAAAVSIESVAAGRVALLHADPRFYLNVLQSFFLTRSSAGTPQPSNWRADFNNDDITAALGSWTMIGMITGLPPYFSDQPPGDVSITYRLNTTAGTDSQLSTSKTVTVGATCGPVKGSLAQAVVTTDDSVTNTEHDTSLTFSTGAASILPPELGVIIYWAPAYQCGTYSIANALKQPNGLTLSMVWASGFGLISQQTFSLTDLNTPVDDTPLSAAFAKSFPSNAAGTSQIAWPRSDDPGAWMLGIPPFTKMASVQPNQMQVATTGSIEDGLTFSTTQSTTSDNNLTISLSANATAFQGILGLSVSGEFSLTSKVESILGQTQIFTATYDALVPSAPVKSFVITPLLLLPDGTGVPPWLPSFAAAQQPWLLTWQVGLGDAVVVAPTPATLSSSS